MAVAPVKAEAVEPEVTEALAKGDIGAAAGAT